MRTSDVAGTSSVNEGYVLDASVALRWYAPQVGYEHAREVRQALVDGAVRLVAPDICRWEVSNALRRLWLRGALPDAASVITAATDLDVLGVTLQPMGAAETSSAARLALAHSLSLFDAAYVTVALSVGLPLLTADARLARAVNGLISTELLRGVGAAA